MIPLAASRRPSSGTIHRQELDINSFAPIIAAMKNRVTRWIVIFLLLSPGLMAQSAPRQQAAAAQPAYDAAQFDEFVRSIAAGADSLQRAQAITLQLARLRIPYDSRPFESGNRAGTNILASLPAPNPGAPVLMIGAHLDRVAAGKGAVDNGAGVSVVLQLLAAFKRAPLKKYQLVAAFWDQEENGLAGSQAFVSSQARDRLPAVYINFDMLAYGDTLCAYWKDDKSASAQAFRRAAADRLPLVTNFQFPPSDDRPFVAAGVEVVAVALAAKPDIELGLKMMRGESAQPPRIMTIMHTTEDTPDKVSSADVTRALPVIAHAIRLIGEN